MNLKILAKVAVTHHIADSKLVSFSDPSSEEARLFIKEGLKKDIISKARTQVSWAAGSDKPGEYVAWGPISKHREALEKVKSMEDLIEGYKRYHAEELADVLGVSEDDLEDLEITEEVEDKVYESFFKPKGKGEYALVVYDWDDLGAFVTNNTVSEKQLLEFLLGEEYSDYYSECPWGLYQCMLLAGLDPSKFIYVNSNDDVSGLPTTESVSEELEDQVWELTSLNDDSHFFFMGNRLESIR